ncbi:HAMP domain-containing histidine kinase [Candidatus Roizmanbacteria bacterium]|nr:HAMP domain-containing histidine kinase [Candidatus Roizmanbacteria bacterium]
MFHSARIKLTAWYLLIIMVVSMVFSLAIYEVLHTELQRFAHVQRLRIERQIVPLPIRFDPKELYEAEDRIRLILIMINAGILVIAGGLGYLLAGRTLRPIQEMVDEQNRFIADASHELRTPLTSLKSSIEVNLRDTHLSLAEAKLVLESNLEEVNELQSLSDALLQLAQYQRVNKKNMLEEVSLKAIMEQSLKKARCLAEKKQIIISSELEEIIMKADSNALFELFIILLDNAIKYSPEKSNIFVGVKKGEASVMISVADEGRGIDKKDVPYIFDRFYRVDKSRSKEKSEGYGLGLAIAMKIVKTYKGTIEVSPNKDKGTVFTVRIPLS